ncbi:MAG TPA: hypothetical protein VD926_10985, partial [Acidimicrobiales bacterium]|nr:hypothetical protein [Acidimicrobiales bacterium]
LLFVLFLGYLAVRRLPADPDVRSKRAAIAGLIAFVDVPIVHYSVEWWRTLHQGPTITRLDPQIDGLMLFSLMLGMVVFLLIYLWLMVHRFRVAYLEEQVDQQWLDRAIEERGHPGERDEAQGAGGARARVGGPLGSCGHDSSNRGPKASTPNTT